jgi:hypothetical protein
MDEVRKEIEGHQDQDHDHDHDHDESVTA